MYLALLSALSLGAGAEEPLDAAPPPPAPPPAECAADLKERGEIDGWAPRSRWIRTVNVGYAQYQRVRLEGGMEYRIESCAAEAVSDQLRISVYDSRALLKVQSWSPELTFIAPKSGDYSIGVDTRLSEEAPADVVLLISSREE